MKIANRLVRDAREIINRKNKKIDILDTAATLEEMVLDKKSICRFGDYEFDLINGRSVAYQMKDLELVNKLRYILKKGSDEKCFVGIPYSLCSLSQFNNKSKVWWFRYFASNREKIMNYLNKDSTYADSQISRIYINRRNKNLSKYYFDCWKKIWQDRKVLLVEGEASRFGVGNDLFDNCKTIRRILCPKENAFKSYKQIMNAILQTNDFDIILLCLGPTATVLAYELAHIGYWSIDIGNMDMEYEWMKNKTQKPIAINGKYTIEAPNGTNDYECNDEKYISQIIERIV